MRLFAPHARPRHARGVEPPAFSAPDAVPRAAAEPDDEPPLFGAAADGPEPCDTHDQILLWSTLLGAERALGQCKLDLLAEALALEDLDEDTLRQEVAQLVGPDAAGVYATFAFLDEEAYTLMISPQAQAAATQYLLGRHAQINAAGPAQA